MFARRTQVVVRQVGRARSRLLSKIVCPFTIAPMLGEQVFERVFSDKINLKHFLNSSLDAGEVPETRQIAEIHNIDVSKITTTASFEESEQTVLFDCWCTFHDRSHGSFKMLKTFDEDSIARDIADCAKLDYWKQWKEHKEFRHPVRILVLNLSVTKAFSEKINYVKVDVRHVCPGLHHFPPPLEFSALNLMANCLFVFLLESCHTDIQRWSHLLFHSFRYDIQALPAVFAKEPFKRAIDMCRMTQFSHEEHIAMCDQSTAALLGAVERQEMKEREKKKGSGGVKRVVVVLDMPEE